MNLDNLQELMRNSLQMSVGATVTLLETLQDPNKREQSLSKLQQNLSQLPNTLTDPYLRDLKLQELQMEWLELSETWAKKGQTTEQDARQFVETLMTQAGFPVPANRYPSTTINTTATPVTPSPSSEYQRELQELILEISTLRTELENDRQNKS